MRKNSGKIAETSMGHYVVTNLELDSSELDSSHINARTRSYLPGFIQVLDLTTVVIVGFVAILPQRFPQSVVIIALALLLLPFVLRLLILGRLTTPTLVNVPIALLLLLMVGTCWVTPSWRYTWPEMVRMLWGIALFLAVVNWLNPWPVTGDALAGAQGQWSVRLIIATVVFLGLGLALTTIGLLGMQPTYKIEHLGLLLQWLPKLHINGIDGFNSNRVAGIMVLFAPLAFALAIGPLRLRRRSWLLWFLVKIPATLLVLYFSVSLLLTQTRGAWLAFACAVVLILSLLGRRGWLLLALVAIMAAAGLYAYGPSRLLQQLTVHDPRASAQVAAYQDRNLSARFILWQRALHGLADAPFTGMGLAAFEAVSQEPYPQVKGYTPDADMTHVHNLILQAGVDFGVPGVIALVSLFILTGRLLVIMIRRTHSPSLLHTWSLGICGSFVAFFVYNMANATTLGSAPAFAVWYLLGICVGAGEWVQRHMASSQVVAGHASASLPALMAIDNDWTDWENRAWAATAGSEKK
jgi:O-antigen ligase